MQKPVCIRLYLFWRALFPVLALMIVLSQQRKVFNLVIALVSVYVMNVIPFGNAPEMRFVHLPVQVFRVIRFNALVIAALIVPGVSLALKICVFAVVDIRDFHLPPFPALCFFINAKRQVEKAYHLPTVCNPSRVV